MTDAISYYAFTLVNKLCPQALQEYDIGKYIYNDPGAMVDVGLYIGSLATALDADVLDSRRIDVVVNLSGTHYVSNRRVYPIIMDDAPITCANIDDYMRKFRLGVQIITEARSNGHNVLVHCLAGVNRSATLLAMYLMSRGYSHQEAINMLATANMCRRTPLITNQSFRQLLRTTESYTRYFKKEGRDGGDVVVYIAAPT